MAKTKTQKAPATEADEPKEKRSFTCPRCQATAESHRAPRGWRLAPGGELICDACWDKGYWTRVIRMPVAGPFLPGGETPTNEVWTQLRTSMVAAWDASTALANWTVTEILRNEQAATTGERLPTLTPYLYGAFGESPLRPQWEGAAQSANALMRTVEKNYRSKRVQIQRFHSISAPTFRWPYPYPVSNQAYSLRIEQEHAILSVPIAGTRWDLKLRNDRTSRGQLRQIQQIIAGEGAAGELKLLGRPVASNDRRNGISYRRPGGGESRWVRLMVMISANLPRPEVGKGLEGVLRVYTRANGLLGAEMEGDTEPWLVNGDHIREWVIASAAMRQRWSDDTKAECRMPARRRRRRNDAGERHNGKYQRRLQTACDEVSAWVVNYARRRRAQSIVYDDRVRDFCPKFAYANLRLLVQRKAEQAGIGFIGTAAEEVPDAE